MPEFMLFSDLSTDSIYAHANSIIEVAIIIENMKKYYGLSFKVKNDKL